MIKEKTKKIAVTILAIMLLITVNIPMPVLAENSEMEESAITEQQEDKEPQAEQSQPDDITANEKQIDKNEQKQPSSVKEPEAGDVDVQKKQLTQNRLQYECDDYTVTVESEENIFTDEAELIVTELTKDDEGYKEYYKQTKVAMLDQKYEDADHINLMDITIMDGEEEIEPSEKVTVKIEYSESLDINRDQLSILHFKKDEKEPDVIEEVEIEGSADSISFDTESFSVYAIVEGVQLPVLPDESIKTIDQIDGQDLYIYGELANTYYAKDGFVTVKGIQCLTRSKNDESDGVLYHFTKVPGTDNQFYIQHPGTGNYLCMDNSGNMSFNANSGTAFIIEYFNTGVEGVFYIYKYGNNNNKYCINMKGGDNATGGFGGSTYKDDGSKMLLKKPSQELPVDGYGLNGKEYALILYKPGSNEAGSVAAGALNSTRGTILNSMPTGIVMDPSGENDRLYVAKDTDLGMWTFHAQDYDKYYISTEVNGQTKYLQMNGYDLRLVDTPDGNCVMKIKAGEVGTPYEGKYQITNLNYYLTLKEDNLSNGFVARIPSSSNFKEVDTWFNFAEKSSINESDFTSYKAEKISVSDPSVTNGSQVIVYTRVWNNEEKKYDFYAIDHDGGLIQCYEYGDTIWWKEGRVNTLLWDFTEYYYEGTTDPNYYYELQNVYSGKYLAPQILNNTLLSDEPIGITMNGRRYGDYYSKILAWDDLDYDYAGLSVVGAQLKSVPMSKADEFYFAIPQTITEGTLSDANTVDNNDYGISMTMSLYDRNQINGNRNNYQTNILGNSEETYRKLVSTNLGPDGYPTSLFTNNTIAPLFANGVSTDHIFIKHTHDESGYFEYDCTQNFAHLIQSTADPYYGQTRPDGSTYEVGDFVVFNQLGSFSTVGLSSKHGQFMPYNEIVENRFSTTNFNTTDVMNNELLDSNPRKGEKLFSINQSPNNRNDANYFFGMELNAAFMQNESGQDQFGHDLIFEFSGDDDMWLYIDGELVLDLGGVHSAFNGTINYKTGVVTMRRYVEGSQTSQNKWENITTTLRDIFAENYKTEHPGYTQQELDDYINSKFDGNTFKDYTAHSMKMLYMERGAGSSNLHMKFNLTTVEDGEFHLSKNVSGTDKQDYLSLEFPYQVEYFDVDAHMWRTLEQATLPSGKKVFEYYNESTPIRMAADNKTFYLKAGETAVVHLESDDIQYRVIEKDVHTNIYNVVEENGENTTKVVTGNDRADFYTDDARVGDRKKVTYNNHVDPNALRTLSLTKKLFDAEGNSLSESDDNTTFRFRIYLGEDEHGNPEYYRLGTYCVKNADNEYCRYDASQGRFVSTGEIIFDNLTAEQKEKCTFTTSPSGAVDKIPADYTVEIRGLIEGTRFQVVERESDIPNGYKFVRYDPTVGSYTQEQGDPINRGTVAARTDPEIKIDNKKGWGITAVKEWTDESFMQSHDTIYLGVCNSNGLVPNTLRAYTNSTKSLYWYLNQLDGTFSEYSVKEFDVKNPQVNSDGYVTSYTSAVPYNAGDEITVQGIPVSGSTPEDFEYIVDYEQGTATGVGGNLRTDEVENISLGVCLIKTDQSGNPIQGGTFTLKDSNDDPVGANSYAAGKNGIITTAHLPDGTYKIEESSAPRSYKKLISAVTFTVSNGVVTSISDNTNCSVTQNGDISEIRIKNRQAQLQFIKMDEDLQETIEGAKFALYKEIDLNPGTMKDYRPMEGYEEMETDANGVIPDINFTLKPGTYYLEEKAAAPGFLSLGDVKFTVNDDASVTLDSGPAVLATDSSGSVMKYTIKVKNREYNGIQILKVNSVTGNTIQNVGFDLYTSADYNTVTNEPLSGRSPVVSDATNANGIINAGKLPNGTYYLVETDPPLGYQPLSGPVRINIYTDGVTAEGCQVTKSGKTYQIEIENTPDEEIIPLPTGINYRFSHLLLVLGAVFILMRYRRKMKEDIQTIRH